MNVDGGDKPTEEEGNDGEDGFLEIHVALLQGKELPSNRAYLDNCSTITACKNREFPRRIHTVKKGIQMN